MLALNDQTKGSNVSPAEWNGFLSEVQNAIEDTGITLDADNLNQLGEAISNYMLRSTFYTGGGTAAAQTLTKMAGLEAPDSYRVGMRVFWRPSNDSVNGGTTIAVDGMVAKTLLQEDGTAITDAIPDLDADRDAEARYDGTNFLLIGF